MQIDSLSRAGVTSNPMRAFVAEAWDFAQGLLALAVVVGAVIVALWLLSYADDIYRNVIFRQPTPAEERIIEEDPRLAPEGCTLYQTSC
jgi:hypothetical protein